ncbi:MAG: CGNR zinc finger domain-containing protein [Dehalococcoidia bacterium]
MDPAERDLLLQFLWTRDESDTIDSPSKLRDWLLGLKLIEPDDDVSDDDVRLARHFRAATRALCVANSGYDLDPRTNKTIDELNAVAPLKVTVLPGGGLDIQPGGKGVPRALSTFLALSYKATAEGEFARFKTCKGCGWAFYDESKNGSKKWCDMGLCGTRSKMKAYRERKKAQA